MNNQELELMDYTREMETMPRMGNTRDNARKKWERKNNRTTNNRNRSEQRNN